MQVKLKKGKKAVAGSDDPEQKDEEWEVKVTAATKAIGLRWLRLARENVERKFRERGDKLRCGPLGIL
jgi:hypothetical protein